MSSIILQLVFHGEFAEEAAEFAFPASHPGNMDGLGEYEDRGVYHISDFLWEAEEGRLALGVDGFALRLGFFDLSWWCLVDRSIFI